MEIPALADLLDLQAVDLEIDRLIDHRQNLPELSQYRLAAQERGAAEEAHAELAGELRGIDLELDRAEGELEILENRLDEAETRLFAGGMSAKETEHKRLEVRSLGAQKEAMEEKVLGLLEQREALAARVTGAGEELTGLQENEARLEAVIKEAWRVIDLDLGRKEARKAEMIPPIPANLLELYEQLRGTKEGVAVGQLIDGQCGGCHLHLSPSEQAEATETDPPRCVHCRRILVL